MLKELTGLNLISRMDMGTWSPLPPRPLLGHTWYTVLTLHCLSNISFTTGHLTAPFCSRDGKLWSYFWDNRNLCELGNGNPHGLEGGEEVSEGQLIGLIDLLLGIIERMWKNADQPVSVYLSLFCRKRMAFIRKLNPSLADTHLLQSPWI